MPCIQEKCYPLQSLSPTGSRSHFCTCTFCPTASRSRCWLQSFCPTGTRWQKIVF